MPLDLPTANFVDNVGTQLSATALLDPLMRAATQLDQLSYRPQWALASTASSDTGHPGRNFKGDRLVAAYGLRYRAGMTTLRIEGFIQRAGTETIQIRLNDTPIDTITSNGGFGHSQTLTGFNEGDVLRIDVWKLGTTNGTGDYRMTAVYGTPVVLSDPWPNVPTPFNGVFSASKINQLIRAADWLYRRIDAVGIPPYLMHLNTMGLHKLGTYELGRWTVTKYHSNDIVRVTGRAETFNPAEKLRVFLNGVLATERTYGPGQRSLTIPLALTGAIGTKYEVRLDIQVTQPSLDDRGRTNGMNRGLYTIQSVNVEPDGNGYPVAGLLSFLQPNTPYHAESLNQRLNNVRTLLLNTKSRLDTNFALWNRVQALRRNYANVEGQWSKLLKWYIYRGYRRGSRLMVRGRGVKIGWLGLEFSKQEEEQQVPDWKPTKQETVISGDATQTQVVYFDNLDGLVEGLPYYVWSEEAPIEYIEERLI